MVVGMCALIVLSLTRRKMSKHGMKLGGKTVFSIEEPGEALEAMERVIAQYFGEQWTQFLPKCPLCDELLSDCEKHMMMPVGECTNEKCMSTIHTSDFMGKLRDIIVQWNQSKEQWTEDMKKEVLKKHKKVVRPTGNVRDHHGCGTPHHGMGGRGRAVSQGSRGSTNTETVFIW